MSQALSKKWSVKSMTFTALFAVIIAICSWISVPTVVPFTLQTFGVFCAVGFLGGKRGTVSVLIYIILGAIGIPVFAGFSAGAGVLFGATGGYIVGFLVLTIFCWATEKLFGKKLLVSIISMAVGLFLCYAVGTVWFMVVYARSSEPVGVGMAISWCVLPFVIPDLIKMGLAIFVTNRLAKYVRA